MRLLEFWRAITDVDAMSEEERIGFRFIQGLIIATMLIAVVIWVLNRL